MPPFPMTYTQAFASPATLRTGLFAPPSETQALCRRRNQVFRNRVASIRATAAFPPTPAPSFPWPSARDPSAAPTSIPDSLVAKPPVIETSATTLCLLTLIGPDAPRNQDLQNALSRILSSRMGAAITSRRQLSENALELSIPLRADATSVLQPASLFMERLQSITRPYRIDAILQTETSVRTPKLLAVFDMDSTLIAEETIDELAAEVGVHAQRAVKEITVRAMNGEIAFREALSERVAVLAGMPESALDRVRARATFTPGARELVNVLKKLGCETAVVSGGFEFLAKYVQNELGIDHSFANKLQVDQSGLLTGTTLGPVVDGQFKMSVLKELADKRGLTREQTMAVGDGSNDVLMVKSAGLGVAFNGKRKLQMNATARVNQPSLYSVLYLLGLDDEQIQQTVASR